MQRAVWIHHLKTKLETLGILVAAALTLTAAVWLLFQASFAFWPPDWQQELSQWQAQPLLEIQQLKQQIQHLPALPLYFISLQLAQVILAPIPGQLIGLMGGWLFGFWQGLSLSLLGLGLGSLIAMLIGRYAGRWLLDHILPPKLFARFDHMVEDSGLFTFFMLFLMPGLPDDALCVIAGMTPLGLPALMLACLVGRLPGLAMSSWLGAEFSQSTILQAQHSSSLTLIEISLAALVLLSLLLWLCQEPLEEMFAKWSKGKIEN